MYNQVIDQFSDSVKPSSSFPKAQTLQDSERQQLGVQMIVREQSVTEIAKQRGVSRKFLYNLQYQAQRALHDAFHHDIEDDKVLFHLPVTKKWLAQFVIALVLICHS